MAKSIMQTAFRWLKTLCEQRFDVSKHYLNNVSMAQIIAQTGFRWLEILCKQRFDGSKHYVNSVSMAQNMM